MEQRTSKGRQKLKLGDILVQQNVITPEKLQEALKKQRGSGKKLGEEMVENNMTTEEAIGQALRRSLWEWMRRTTTYCLLRCPTRWI